MSEYIDKWAFINQTKDTYCTNCKHRKNDKGKFVYEIGGVRCRACDIGDMMNAVDDFPAADVAPVVHGHWVVEDLSVLETYTCSVCKHVTAYFGVKYCPECGTKMDESEDKSK